jgi:hypothetical protein
MTTRDMDKIKVLISEAKIWVDSNSSNTGYWYTDDEGRQVPARYLTTEAIKRMLENLKLKLLKDDEPESLNTCKDITERTKGA